jgi:hypothetical protein
LGEKVGRPRKPYIEKEAEVIKAAHAHYRFGARMLETVIRKQFKICISHNRIHMYLKAEGLTQEDLKNRSAGSGFVMNESTACLLGISTGMNGMGLMSRSAYSG